MSGTSLMLLGECNHTALPSDEPSERIIEWIIAAPAVVPAVLRPPLSLSVAVDCDPRRDAALQSALSTAMRELCAAMTPPTHATLLASADVLAWLEVAPTAACTHVCASPLFADDAEIDLAALWQQAGALLDHAAAPQAVRHVLLLSSGRAPVAAGRLRTAQVRRHTPRQRDISTSVIAIGLRSADVILEALALDSGGAYHFAEGAPDVLAVCRQEMHDLQALVAHDVRLTIQASDGVGVRVLGDLPTVSTGDGVIIRLGNVAAGERRSCFTRLTLPPGRVGATTRLFGMITSTHVSAPGATTVSAEQILTYLPPAQTDERNNRPSLCRHAAEVESAAIIARALRLHHEGHAPQARHFLLETLAKAPPALTEALQPASAFLLAQPALQELERRLAYAASYRTRMARM